MNSRNLLPSKNFLISGGRLCSINKLIWGQPRSRFPSDLNILSQDTIIGLYLDIIDAYTPFHLLPMLFHLIFLFILHCLTHQVYTMKFYCLEIHSLPLHSMYHFLSDYWINNYEIIQLLVKSIYMMFYVRVDFIPWLMLD